MSTKHIALAVNEELTLQTRLIVCLRCCSLLFLLILISYSNEMGLSSMQDDLDYDVDITDSRLRVSICFEQISLISH